MPATVKARLSGTFPPSSHAKPSCARGCRTKNGCRPDGKRLCKNAYGEGHEVCGGTAYPPTTAPPAPHPYRTPRIPLRAGARGYLGGDSRSPSLFPFPFLFPGWTRHEAARPGTASYHPHTPCIRPQAVRNGIHTHTAARQRPKRRAASSPNHRQGQPALADGAGEQRPCPHGPHADRTACLMARNGPQLRMPICSGASWMRAAFPEAFPDRAKKRAA